MSKATDGMIWAHKNPEKAREIHERWGIAPPSYGVRSDSANWSEQNKHNQTYAQQVQEAARNDYDLRETTAAAARSGKNKAIELENEGFKKIGDVANWMNFSEKAADRHGQGGDFGSASDYMGLTKSMQIRDRRKQTEEYQKMFASQEDLDDVKSELDKKPKWKDYRQQPPEPSEQLKAAEAIVDKANQGPTSIYDNNNNPLAGADTARDASNAFLYDYTKAMSKKYGPATNTHAGLLAAASIVQGAQNSPHF